MSVRNLFIPWKTALLHRLHNKIGGVHLVALQGKLDHVGHKEKGNIPVQPPKLPGGLHHLEYSIKDML